jgi:Raf kinase inhibitor-like YbhB/YbcL family protein
MSFTLSSPAFADGAPIPQRCSGDGANLSPPLTWQDPPAGTRSFALVVEDPDAPSGTFRHWGIYDIDAETRQLPEGAAGPFAAAVNDNGRQGYGGPRPPKGHGPHHYHFRLMALDTERLDLPPSARVADISRAAQPHLLGEAVLTGIYER